MIQINTWVIHKITNSIGIVEERINDMVRVLWDDGTSDWNEVTELIPLLRLS